MRRNARFTEQGTELTFLGELPDIVNLLRGVTQMISGWLFRVTGRVISVTQEPVPQGRYEQCQSVTF